MGRHSKPGNVTKTARNLAVGGVLTTAATFAAGPGTASADTVPVVDWAPIIRCESGGNPTVDRLAVDGASTASGALQFVDGTWAHYGGLQFAPRAKDATLAEQIIVAERAYAANGLNDWNASKRCWGGKVDTSAPAHVSAAPPATSGRHASGQQAPATTRKAAPPRHAAPAPAPAVVDPAGRYTVRSGDTLSGISVAHGGQDWHKVYERNRAVVGGNPHLIFPGEVLTV